jgi:hypothetical protein
MLGALEAVKAGDVEAFLSILSPEVVLHEPDYLPYGGEYRGRPFPSRNTGPLPPSPWSASGTTRSWRSPAPAHAPAGIARSTLYRKVRAPGLDLSTSTF